MNDLDALWRRNAEIAGSTRSDFRFDPVFYARQTGRDFTDEAFERAHFDEHGANLGVAPTLYDELYRISPAIDGVIAELVVDERLAEAIRNGADGAHRLAFELMALGAPIDSAVSNFSAAAYLTAYADISQAAVHPLVHYVMHGREEGRRTLADFRKSRAAGRRRFDPGLPTVLVGVHEMSRTGAPIVGLDLVREAASTHNVVVVSLRRGPLYEAFLEYASDVIVTENPELVIQFFDDILDRNIEFALMNSIECLPIVKFLVKNNIRYASYIHEYTVYTFPAYKVTFTSLFADFLVFSSEHVRDSWRGALTDICFDVERDSTILPQRRLAPAGVAPHRFAEARKRLSKLLGRDLAETRIVCGAGHLQWRKGSDLFAAASTIMRRRDPNTVFIWIGDGVNAEDIHFGTWMNFHLQQIGADAPGTNLHLIPAGEYYRDVLAAADAMFLSSRLDPLPNVVFDALEHGCRIVQFDGASGFGDEVYRKTGLIEIVPYGDLDAAAGALQTVPRKRPIEASGE